MHSYLMFSLAACQLNSSRQYSRDAIDPLLPYNLDVKSVNIKAIPDSIVSVLAFVV